MNYFKYDELVRKKLRDAGFKKHIVDSYITIEKEHCSIYVDDTLKIQEMELIIKTLNEVREIYNNDYMDLSP